MERLDKMISSASEYSRSEIKKMIRSGRISVNNENVSDLSLRINADSDEIKIDGLKFEYKKYVYIMMNKPKGVISASRDKKIKTVIDLVPDELRRDGLFPAGRLDGDTIGFILITNDGKFAHNMLAPKKHVPKTYEVLLDANVPYGTEECFEKGIVLSDGTVLKPASLKVLDESICKYEIVITEGRYHQVKRMFASVGRKVIELKRVKIGKLQLDSSLQPGECREMTKEELTEIFCTQ